MCVWTRRSAPCCCGVIFVCGFPLHLVRVVFPPPLPLALPAPWGRTLSASRWCMAPASSPPEAVAAGRGVERSRAASSLRASRGLASLSVSAAECPACACVPVCL